MYVEAKEKGMPTFEASSIGNFKLKAAAVATAPPPQRRALPPPLKSHWRRAIKFPYENESPSSFSLLA